MGRYRFDREGWQNAYARGLPQHGLGPAAGPGIYALKSEHQLCHDVALNFVGAAVDGGGPVV